MGNPTDVASWLAAHSDDLMPILKSAGIGLAGIVFGGYTARRKLARDSSFARTLAWYEAFHRASVAVVAKIDDTLAQVDDGVVITAPEFQALLTLVATVDALRREIPLVASPEVLRHVEFSFHNTVPLTPMMLEFPLIMPMYLRQTRDSMVLAGAWVTHFSREHLGLEPLNDLAVQQMFGFVRVQPTTPLSRFIKRTKLRVLRLIGKAPKPHPGVPELPDWIARRGPDQH